MREPTFDEYWHSFRAAFTTHETVLYRIKDRHNTVETDTYVVRNPRCASVSLKLFILKNWYADAIETHFWQKDVEYSDTVIGLIRDPWSWLLSCFNYLHQFGPARRRFGFPQKEVTENFPLFVDAAIDVIRNRCQGLDLPLYSQWAWMGVNNPFRISEAATEIPKLLPEPKHGKIIFPFPHEHKSKQTVVFHSETEDKIATTFAREIEEFGFTRPSLATDPS